MIFLQFWPPTALGSVRHIQVQWEEQVESIITVRNALWEVGVGAETNESQTQSVALQYIYVF